MAPLWILGIFLVLQTTLAGNIVEPGPPSGIVLQDAPGLLLTNCRVHTQRVYTRLDPWDVYRKHFRSPTQTNLETGPDSEIGSNIEHAKRTTVHMLEQLQKFIVTEEELSGKTRPKRFLGGLLTAASAIGSLFSMGLSAVNTVSLTAVKREMNILKEEMPEIQGRLLTQQEELQGLGKTLQGTILTVNMHSTLIKNTVHAVDRLATIMRSEVKYVRVIRDLMQDLMREVSSSLSTLSGGKIPPYLIPLSMVDSILRSTTTTNVYSSQIHLAYSLGSAIPIFVNPQNLEIGFILNLPVIERQNIYRIKSVLNVGFWNNDVHVRLQTPSTIAYHDDNPSIYLVPNLDMCTSTKDIHWVCPSNPFIRDTTDRLCGLIKVPDQKCAGKLSIKDEGIGTRVERAGNRWLINTPQTEILVSYDQHNTATRMKIPNETSLLSVPLGATVHVGDITLHHLSADQYETEIEMPDAFPGHELEINSTLQAQLLLEGTKTVQFDLKPTGIATTFLNNRANPSSDQGSLISRIALGFLAGGWVITVFIAITLHRYILTLHRKLDKTIYAPEKLDRGIVRFSIRPKASTNFLEE
ncbi:uncharacterized protein LOC132896459 [Neoarius graeffei]|uniref:uncharacterized protein LOC132896459 n=1 Tax=Neoarius graeffei TaxID=443677 RepID=UPI00298C64D2|nr:uncharacterized protein LOC132896459 [Neoarius graeffei]